jgi:hypothetical protein
MVFARIKMQDSVVSTHKQSFSRMMAWQEAEDKFSAAGYRNEVAKVLNNKGVLLEDGSKTGEAKIPDTTPPAASFKLLGVRTFTPNCVGTRALFAYMEATFDDVQIGK